MLLLHILIALGIVSVIAPLGAIAIDVVRRRFVRR